MQSSRRPLSARRSVQRNTKYEEALDEFMRMPIDLSHETPVFQFDSREVKHYKKRCINDINQQNTSKTDDQIIAARRRAFRIKHQIEKDKATKGMERCWKEDEKYRAFKFKKQSLPRYMRQAETDKHRIEDIVQERNNYYVSTCHDAGIIPRTQTKSLRVLPPEMRAATSSSEHVYFWGS